MTDGQKYSFSWGLIGDISQGGPNLADSMRLEVPLNAVYFLGYFGKELWDS